MNRSNAATAPRQSKKAARTDRATAAMTHLSTSDERLARLIRRVGPFQPKLSSNPFQTLVSSIVSQQISTAAARSIQGRLVAACGGTVSPERLMALRAQKLRSCGLSPQKLRYLRDLCAHFADGRLTNRALVRMEDEAVIEATTQVLGIGRWTAEMLLIFCLERPDVWPIDDLGIRKASAMLTGSAEHLKRDAMAALAEPWRPFRSYASWYLWRSLELPADEHA